MTAEAIKSETVTIEELRRFAEVLGLGQFLERCSVVFLFMLYTGFRAPQILDDPVKIAAEIRILEGGAAPSRPAPNLPSNFRGCR